MVLILVVRFRVSGERGKDEVRFPHAKCVIQSFRIVFGVAHLPVVEALLAVALILRPTRQKVTPIVREATDIEIEPVKLLAQGS